MRKIEKDMLKAINDWRDWSCKNTQVQKMPDREALEVLLHGNVIARISAHDCVWFTHAGLATRTTFSRLNAIASGLRKPVRFGTRKHSPEVVSLETGERQYFERSGFIA